MEQQKDDDAKEKGHGRKDFVEERSHRAQGLISTIGLAGFRPEL